MTGAPEGSPKVVLCGLWVCFFMEKPGIEPATPGLQGIALIHYTTGASLYHGGHIKSICPTNGISYYYNYDFSNIYELTEILISLNFFFHIDKQSI